MYKYTKLIRLFLASLGLFTVLVSSTVIFHAVTFLSSQPRDALLYVSIVALLLGIFLALGGACLAFRGAKYNE